MTLPTSRSTAFGTLPFIRTSHHHIHRMSFVSRLLRASSLLLFTSAMFAPAQNSGKFPFAERLTYQIDWHSIIAGGVKLETTRGDANNWLLSLNLESAGMVSRLYRVLDAYKVTSNSQFCGASSMLDAQEGKRHRITRLTFEEAKKKVQYDERDLIKNSTTHKELDVPSCTHEIAGALASLRLNNVDPGKSIYVPITDGKKIVNAKIEAQAKETLTISGKTYNTTRYEAFLFDNVLYSRKGRLFLWLTDEPDHVPVQLRVQLGFPVGTILLQLDKQEKL